MQKYLVGISSAAILALLALVYYQGRQAGIEKTQRENENLHYQQRVSEIQARLSQERAALERERKSQATKDSIFRASISAQKAKTARSEKTTADLRPQINELADSVAVLAQFLQANDSVLTGKDLIITLLAQKNLSDSLSHTREVSNLENQIVKLTNEAADDQKFIADMNEKVAKAEKKANKRFSVGLSAGYSVTQYDNKLVTGPSITGGVQYRLFSF